MKADLHMHTKYSFDGEKEVDEIIQLAKEAGMDLISITDHNQVEGSLRCMADNRIECISGIEIDCFDGETIHHILGYGCDLTDPRFIVLKENYEKELVNLTHKRIDMFNTMFGLTLSLSDIKKEYPQKTITNIEITKYMFKNIEHEAFKPYITGERKHNPIANFYWDHLAFRKPGYIHMNLPSTQDVIDLIHDTRGIAIIAHPMIMGVPLEYYDQMTEIDGIEACCSYHSPSQVQEVIAYAKAKKMLITCGSDYHGINKPNIHIGQCNEPEDFNDEWIKELLDRL